MKKMLLVLSLVIFSATGVYAKESVSTNRFKHHMHEIFKNYRNTNIAINMHEYALAEIHTKHMLENISKIPDFTQDLAADGVTFDQASFLARLDALKGDIAEIRKALKARQTKKLKKFQPDVMQNCIGCHTEAKLKWLFHLPVTANLFEEYMHEISDNIALVEQLIEAGEMDEAGDYAAIAYQYLLLLKEVTPYQGPSGTILDRNRHLAELRNAEGFLLLILEDFKMKKPIEMATVKEPLNKVCVACHEPAKIK